VPAVLLAVCVAGLASAATPAHALILGPGDLWSWVVVSGPLHEDDAFYDVAVAGVAKDTLYAVGSTDRAGAQDGYLLMAQYDASGDGPAWARSWRPFGAVGASATAVTTDNDGNVIAAGTSWNGAHYDIVVIKRDPSGAVVWTDVKDGATHGNDVAADVVTDGAGNVYVCGSLDGYAKAVVLKYAAAADPLSPGTAQPLWERATRPTTTPGSAEAAALAYADGAIYVTGSRDTKTDDDCFLRKLGRDGSTKWIRGWDGAAHRHDGGQAVSVFRSSGPDAVYVAGGTETRTHSNDVMLLRYSTTGKRIWARTWDGPTHSSDEVWDLAVDGHGRPCVVGCTFVAGMDNKALLVAWTAGGTRRWTRTYRVDADGQAAFSGVVAGGSAIWVVGHADSATSRDWVAAKYAGSGTREWLTRWSGPPGDPRGGSLSACVACASGGLFAAGRVSSTAEGENAAVGWFRR
jgi:hypothetical protein